MGKRFSPCGSTCDRYWRDPSLAWRITRTRRGAVLHGFPVELLTPETRLSLAIFGRWDGTVFPWLSGRVAIPAWLLARVRMDCAGLAGC